MRSEAANPEDYLKELSKERRMAISDMRKAVLNNLPAGFIETMNYGMIGYVVPHTLYPAGYHCSPELPLPFINIASQKNYIALYHAGIYADIKILDWFVREYAKQVRTKLDMGKSCIRFKKPEAIPFQLIGELASKITVNEWIEIYEQRINR